MPLGRTGEQHPDELERIMLNLYAARESIDKERFIFENAEGETFVIVPEQYTLVAEEQAIRYTKTDCLFDIEILSMSRLGHRLLAEKGEEAVRMLDKHGRFMLLTGIINEHREELEVFRRSAGKLTFTNMVSDIISEFKQNNCTEEELEELLEGEETDPLLRAKLRELKIVLDAYEEAISGRYTDAEDYISMYTAAMKDSKLISGKNIWIYGYDTVTPKFTRAMLELSKYAGSVSFMVNRNDFGLDEMLISRLARLAAEENIEFSCSEIDSSFAAVKSETIRRIEAELWSTATGRNTADDSFIPEGLTLVSASNPYYEAESAAAFIWHLIRDKGYRMRDIQIISNDETVMQPILKRTFEEYGLPLFMDSSRKITDTVPVAFIVNLLRFRMHRQLSGYLFAMLKTGLAGVPEDLTEELENYARDYHIKGSMWDKPFKYGREALGEEKLEALNELRETVMRAASGLKDLCHSRTVSEFAERFKSYLEDEWRLSEMVQKAAEAQDEAGRHDEAQRTLQSYDKALELIDQIVEIMGDSEFELKEFTDMYTAGLTNVEVGVIPSSADGLSVGTMIRTRPRPVRAAVIVGANEGTLPLSPSPKGIFSVDEKEYFISKGFALGALDDLKMKEEDAAMYRLLSKPSETLYISWSACNADGGDVIPSPLIESLRTLFPAIGREYPVMKDVVSRGWGLELIHRPEKSLGHMAAHLKEYTEDKSDPLTEALMRWYRDNLPQQLDDILRIATTDNVQEPVGSELAGKLFSKDGRSLVLSASAINSYFDCPFKYFVERGLRPREERDFRGDARSIGDAYHECLRAVAHRLTADRELLETVCSDDEAMERIVSEELERFADSYRDGLFISTGNEEYRMSRIREICAEAASAMAKQLAADSLIAASFEESFGRNGRFEPIRLHAGDKEIIVEGKIDRVDILRVGDEERVRIIDYKTGSESLDLDRMKIGYRMQLMIYMMSVLGTYEPAGLFYFIINDPIRNMNPGKNWAAPKSEAPDPYLLKGEYINESGVLASMPQEVVSASKSGVKREVFEEVRAAVAARIEETASSIMNGRIDISPLKENNTLCCNKCDFKTVCRRDREYPRNRARELPKKNRGKTDNVD